jgi:hypothetical protein
MDSLANAARAAGFAMAAAEDDAVGQPLRASEGSTGRGTDIYDAMLSLSGGDDLTSAVTSQFAGPRPKVLLGDTFSRSQGTSSRWQGTSKPVALADLRSMPGVSRTGGIFDWLPSFSWRPDGR